MSKMKQRWHALVDLFLEYTAMLRDIVVRGTYFRAHAPANHAAMMKNQMHGFPISVVII